MTDSLTTRQWQNFRKQLIALLPPVCALCGKPIDLKLSGNHPQGVTIDHITPRSRGGETLDPTNCQLAHKSCNSARRNDPIAGRRTSRDW